MYAPASGSGESYNNGITETSVSGSDEENKSEAAYSGQTDYAMVSVKIFVQYLMMLTKHTHTQNTRLIMIIIIICWRRDFLSDYKWKETIYESFII